ncbi:hypothetical protein EmuJ_000050300 [Echinococcus multilocularis]|nr:hypothetical protein EmuJ_000050300 [Echinococcus multilocularis]
MTGNFDAELQASVFSSDPSVIHAGNVCNGLHRRVRWVVYRGCLATEEIATSTEAEHDEETSAPKADATSLLSGERHEGDGDDEATSSSPENIHVMAAINVYKEPIVNVQAMKVLSALDTNNPEGHY